MILRYRLLKVVFLAPLLTFLVPTVALPFQVEITDISDDKYFEVVHEELQKAKESIYVAIYEIFVYHHNKTSPAYILLQDLIDAHNRGVEVKVFLDRSYASAIASFILGLITTLLIFPEFNVAQPGVGVEASIKLFCLAFGFGFGWNSIISEGAKWGERTRR